MKKSRMLQYKDSNVRKKNQGNTPNKEILAPTFRSATSTAAAAATSTPPASNAAVSSGDTTDSAVATSVSNDKSAGAAAAGVLALDATQSDAEVRTMTPTATSVGGPAKKVHDAR